MLSILQGLHITGLDLLLAVGVAFTLAMMAADTFPRRWFR